MSKTEQSIPSLILVPAIVGNVVTLLRLSLELMGFSAKSPSDFAWWVSLTLLTLVFALYFAYMLREAEHPYKKLALTLLLFALSVRIPTAIVYGISGAMKWDTHYSNYGPNGYLIGGLFGQVVIWPIITLVVGMILGAPLLAWLRSGRVKTAST